MKDVSDLVALTLIDYLFQDSLEDVVYKELCCPQIYQRVFISSTGAMMCNSDEYGKEIIGDANYEIKFGMEKIKSYTFNSCKKWF